MENNVPSSSNTDVSSVASHSCTEGNSIEQYLEQRIKQLREADAEFCEWRWGNDPLKRVLGREQSNIVTFARQELETVLKLLNSEQKDAVCDATTAQ